MNRILVTGSKGMLGKNVVASLASLGYAVESHERSKAELTNGLETYTYIKDSKPDTIIHCAALVGGIKANIEGGAAFYKINKDIDSNVIQSALDLEISNFVYIASSCMYPSDSKFALREDEIGNEPLEPTNRQYALAKIEGTHQVKNISKKFNLNWKTLVLSNLYGPYDKFDVQTGHLIGSLITKARNATSNNESTIEMWGDGTPKREFTYAPEIADWLALNINNIYKFPDVMNIGFGKDFEVREYYETVVSLINPGLKIKSRPDLPNGSARKLMNSEIAREFGWNPSIDPKNGIQKTLEWLKRIGIEK